MAALVAVTYPSFPNPPTYEGVTIAFERTLAKIEEAIDAMEKGTDNPAVMKMINEACQLQNEILNIKVYFAGAGYFLRLESARLLF